MIPAILYFTITLCANVNSLHTRRLLFTAENSIGKNQRLVSGLLHNIQDTHAMATCHRGAGCPLDRGLDILVEDTEDADIDNDSTHCSDATVALGGPDVAGHPEDPAYDNQDRLTALTREINDLHQRLAVGEGQPAETLDYIQHELQNLLIAIHQPQPPAPAEPLGEVLCQYTDTLCSTCRNNPI